jgi:hypothetical protein
MKSKSYHIETNQEDRLVNNPDYFKYIFKKTEKIACAVFYILRHDPQSDPEKDLRNDLKESAKDLLSGALMTLRATERNKAQKTDELKFKVIELESMLRVGHAAGVLTGETLAVFINETDSVVRSLRHYSVHEGTSTQTASSRKIALRSNTRQVSRGSQGVGREGISTSEPTLPRKDRILAVLKDKGEASIKDIIEVVTDYSEKTIQRDLISLIKDNLVVREGERRWSKYRLI